MLLRSLTISMSSLVKQTQCWYCVMDRSADEITFDANGRCNFCIQAQKALHEIELEKPNLQNIVKEIKSSRRGKYDVVIGLSGGVDSSMALHYAVGLGLRPLAFTVDTGWNTPEADENILRLVEGLCVPLYRENINQVVFSELQGAFMKAGVPNIEIPTDHILMAVSLNFAKLYNVRWIISGGNVATESIMPPSWGYNARDLRHIKDIYRTITGKKLKGVPVCGLLKWNYYRWIKRIKTLYLLDYFDYNREASVQLLTDLYGYKPYGEKHCESVFTQWFQNFYLFEKFGIDKRKAHFSSLINSRQMSRDTALLELQKPPVYPRLGIEQKIMSYPIKRSHDFFKKDEKIYNAIARFVKIFT